MNTFSKNTIQEIAFASERYPQHLKAMKNPPRVIYTLGNLDLLCHSATASIVGTRSASENGLKITGRIAKYLVERNVAIVSGLALGIDAEAHKKCLEFGGMTIAVLAHGLDMVYPQENKALAQSIIDKNGLLVSEHPPGVRPQQAFFRQRNRVQVGCSKVSIVVEASVASGTMSHAKFCVEANHKLFVVLPDMTNTLGLNFHGPKMMVEKMGAIPIRDKNDYVNLCSSIFSEDTTEHLS